MSDLIDRQAAIDALWSLDVELRPSAIDAILNMLNGLPSAQMELENKIRAIGYTGKEGRIYIGGRLFAVRELSQ